MPAELARIPGPPPQDYFDELENEIVRLSHHSNNVELIRAVLVAGLYPNVATVGQKKVLSSLQTLDDGKVSLYPSSVLFREKTLPYRWLVFTEKVSLCMNVQQPICDVNNFRVTICWKVTCRMYLFGSR